MPSNVRFESVEKVQLLRGGATLRSRYSGKRQTIAFPFALWVMEGKLIPMEGLEAAEWRAFMAQLEGEQNTFQLVVPGVTTPLSGYVGATATNSTAIAARAKSMAVTGTASATLLKKGDYFTFNNELKIATADCILSGVGAGTLAFEPGIRTAVAAAGTPLVLNSPYCVMSLQSNEGAAWSLSKPTRHGINLRAIEAF